MDESLELLAQFQWIYNFKLTHFFVDRVCENIPAQWTGPLLDLSLDELNSLPFGKMKDEWPDTFKRFITTCLENSLPRELTLNYLGYERVIPLNPSDIGAEIQRGMSEKKLHEVCHMTALVDHVTTCAGTRAVVDVGSGLGYLGQVLHGCYGHWVLGLEGKQCHTSGAEKRSVQAEKCPGLQNVTCELQQSRVSMQEFLSLVQEWFHNLPAGGSSWCSHQTGSKTSASCSHNSSNIHVSQSKSQECLGVTNSLKEDKIVSARCKPRMCIQSMCDSNLTSEIEVDNHSQSVELGSAGEDRFKTESVVEGLDEMREVAISEFSDSCKHDKNMGSEKADRFQDDINASDSRGDELLANTTEKKELLQQYQGSESEVNTTLKMMGPSENMGNICDCGVSRNVRDFNVKKSDGQCLGMIELASESESTSQLCLETKGANMLGPMTGIENIQGTWPDSTKMLDPGLDSRQMLDPGPDITTIQGPGPDSKKLLSPGPESTKLVSSGRKTAKMPDTGSEKEDLEEKNKELCDENKKWKTSEDGGVCMVGLHCCGDLTPTMLRYFVELEYIRGLCCVSCCYHRMNYNEATNHFENFPLSRCVQEAMCRMSGRFPGWSLNPYAMRLAAQETRSRWLCQTAEDHEFHTQNVAYRGLLELCLQEGHYVLKKTARKLAHRKDHSTFEAYVDKVSEQIAFPDTDLEGKTGFRHHMMALYDRYQQYFQYIEPFTALQFLIQPVLESLIHKDRQLWLKEHGYHSNIIPVFNEVLSPRNLALVAVKS